MNDVQENKYSMYLVVQDHLDDNAASYADHPKIVAAKPIFDQLILDIEEADGQASENITGVADDKGEERDDLEKIAFKVAGALQSYAKDIKDRKLMLKTRQSLSDFKKMRDGTLNIKARHLHKLATPLLPSLVDYRLTPADVALLETERTEYLDMVPETTDAIIDKQVAGEKVDELMKKADNLLLDVDGYVDSYRFENPTLWSDYQLSRAIIDAGGGGGGGGAEIVFSGTVPPMSNEVKGPVVYNAATPVALQNNSMVTLGFQLQMSGISSGMIVNVPPMSTQNTTLGAMGANGNEIRISNNDMAQSASYTITIG
ncbi:MAG: hypothetical protein AB7G44_12810 [Bacteroidia bacterium]